MNVKPFTDNAADRQSPTIGDSDTLLCGAGIDTNTAGVLKIGETNATKVEIVADVEFLGTTTFPGPVEPVNLVAEFEIDSVATSTNVTAANLNSLTAGTFTGMIQKRTVTVAFDNAALVAANVNGASAVVNIGAALPANSRIVGADFRALTPFTGGGATSVGIAVGTSGDPEAIVAEADVLTAAVDGGPSAITPGVRPWKTFASGGQLIATFTPDAGHKLSELTAGSVVIDVLYTVLA